MDNLDCDIAVVGGGPAGATAALTLARAGFEVLLIECSRYERPRVGETLSPSVGPMLDRLGLRDAFDKLASTPSFGNQSVWGGSELRSNLFIFNPHGNGWHVDRQRFDSMLADVAVNAGARRINDTRVTHCSSTSQASWRLVVRTGSQVTRNVTARAVIDSTGRRATVARWLGAGRRVYDQLVGVAAQYRGAPNDGGFTLVEAAEHGWWYSAPVPPDRMVVMFMTDTDLCRRSRCSNPEVWKNTLAQTQHTYARVDDYELLWKPRVFPAVSHRLEKTGCPGRWLAAGDAAIGVDPLSSSGIMWAFRTGEASGKAMAHWLQGKPEAARAYEHWIDTEFADYLRERQAYYALETRWSGTPFWQRRSEISATQSVSQS